MSGSVFFCLFKVEEEMTQMDPNHSNLKIYNHEGIEETAFTISGLWIKVKS